MTLKESKANADKSLINQKISGRLLDAEIILNCSFVYISQLAHRYIYCC